LSSAQDVFQERVDEIFGDVPACTGIADDCIIAGWKEDGSDHDATLKTVLELARSSGLWFNDDKMVVRCKEIPFFGHIIGENGIRPNPSKVQTIMAMTEPEDIKEVQTFFGNDQLPKSFHYKTCVIECTTPRPVQERLRLPVASRARYGF